MEFKQFSTDTSLSFFVRFICEINLQGKFILGGGNFNDKSYFGNFNTDFIDEKAIPLTP